MKDKNIDYYFSFIVYLFPILILAMIWGPDEYHDKLLKTLGLDIGLIILSVGVAYTESED